MGGPHHSLQALPHKNDLVERGVVTGEVYERIKDYVIAHRDVQ